jgi:hypothetical protein
VQVREGCYGFQSLFVLDEEIGNNIVASGLDRVQQQSFGLVLLPCLTMTSDHLRGTMIDGRMGVEKSGRPCLMLLLRCVRVSECTGHRSWREALMCRVRIVIDRTGSHVTCDM